MPFIIEAVLANDLVALERILISGVDPNRVEDYLDATPLHHAVVKGSYEATLLLLTAGAKNISGAVLSQTPLAFAYQNNRKLFDLLARVLFLDKTIMH